MTSSNPHDENERRGKGQDDPAISRPAAALHDTVVVAAASGASAMQAAGERYYSIGELSDAFDVTTRAIRFYEAKNLISPERRGTTRLYTRRDRARLQMILRGKNLGFTLEEIREFLDLYDADPSMTVQTRHLLVKVESAITDLACKRADIDRSLQELAQIRSECIEHLKHANLEGGRPGPSGNGDDETT